MQTAKSLWASIQGSPTFMRRVNGWLTILWVVMIPISLVMHWLSSVVYVSALSLWALVAGHWSSWQAARVEVEQERQAAQERRDPLDAKVVDRLVRETDIEPARVPAPADREHRRERDSSVSSRGASDPLWGAAPEG